MIVQMEVISKSDLTLPAFGCPAICVADRRLRPHAGSNRRRWPDVRQIRFLRLNLPGLPFRRGASTWGSSLDLLLNAGKQLRHRHAESGRNGHDGLHCEVVFAALDAAHIGSM